MLSRIKLGFPEIRRALLDIDDQKLSIDELRAISKQLPTADEVRLVLYVCLRQLTRNVQINRIQDFQDVSKLAKADQYFGQVSHLPSYKRG